MAPWLATACVKHRQALAVITQQAFAQTSQRTVGDHLQCGRQLSRQLSRQFGYRLA